jgi:predicted PurR-regulated permease PerM
MVEKKEPEIIERVVLTLFFVLMLYLGYLIMRPFLLTIITAAILTYITFPLYKKISARLKDRKVLASIIMVLFVFLVIAAPLSFLGTFIAQESVSGLNRIVDISQEFVAGGGCQNMNSTACVMFDQALDFSRTEFFDRFVKSGMPDFSLLNTGQGFFFSVTGFIVHFFITLFALFFFFIDGEHISEVLTQSLPLKKRYRELIVKRFKDITAGVMYGQLLTSVIQGLVAGLGFFIFGIQSPVLLGLLTAFTSLIPFLGAFSVWFPAAALKIIFAAVNNDMSGVWMGIGLVIYGTIVISTIDNIIKPKFIGDRAQLHPVLALVGVLGGISVFGIIGILLGPLIMALLVSTLEIYRKNIQQLR